jgi:hypothetical protein
VIVESMQLFGEHVRADEPVPVARVATAHVKSVEGQRAGQICHVL